jgi:hypothetical protein
MVAVAALAPPLGAVSTASSNVYVTISGAEVPDGVGEPVRLGDGVPVPVRLGDAVSEGDPDGDGVPLTLAVSDGGGEAVPVLELVPDGDAPIVADDDALAVSDAVRLADVDGDELADAEGVLLADGATHGPDTVTVTSSRRMVPAAAGRMGWVS